MVEPAAQPPYTVYAPYYDAQGQSGWSERMCEHLLSQLLPAYHVQPQSGLDLACGTGSVVIQMAAAGLRAIGLDRSVAMLAVAQDKAQSSGAPVGFVCADLRHYAFQTRFGVITCLYDSLNYLLEQADLATAFARVRDVLTPTGLFVCDLNTDRAFAEAGGTKTLTAGDRVYTNRLTWDPVARICEMELTSVPVASIAPTAALTFRERHVQRAYGVDEVAAALSAAGLRLVRALTSRFEPARPESLKIVYVAARA